MDSYARLGKLETYITKMIDAGAIPDPEDVKILEDIMGI